MDWKKRYGFQKTFKEHKIDVMKAIAGVLKW